MVSASTLIQMAAQYNGQWANGKQHGEGIFITPHGASRKGIWHEGKRTQWIDNED